MASMISSGAQMLSVLLVAGFTGACSADQEQRDMTTASGAGGGSTVGAAAGGSGGGSAGGAPSWAAECKAVVDQNAACGKSSDDDAALQECVGMEVCIGPVYDADAVHALMACLATLPCDRPDDDCITQLLSVPGNDAQVAFVEPCHMKATECPDLAGDLCGMGVWFSDTLVAAIEACFDEPCSTATSCAFAELANASSRAGCGGELPFGG